jgi:heme exporter protein C
MRPVSNTLFPLLAVAAAALFAYAPFLIVGAPYESTMGLVQKIFYFHVPAWFAMFTAAVVCGVGSGVYLFGGRKAGDRVALGAAELVVLFGAIGLITGPLWGRKAWGVWWQWDARLTLSLVVWLTFVAYLLLRRYGGPGSDKLAAGVALFGVANIPFVYQSVNWWRTVHPKTTVVWSLSAGMRTPFWWCVGAFLLLMTLLLVARARLERQRATLDELYLRVEE